MNFLLKERVSVNDKKYMVMETIGEGAYAFVYKVKCLQSDHTMYALKKMICSEKEQLVEARKEIEILSLISHENVIPIIASEFSQNKKGKYEVLLLLPLYSTSLQALIDHGPGYPKCAIPNYAAVVKIISQCVCGLIAIHSAGYRHADFKPGNVLLNEEHDAVVTDLGSACPLSVVVSNRSEALVIQEAASALTTASFRSPELYDPQTDSVIDGKADVWALGCSIYAILFSRTPFESAVEGLSTLAARSGHFSFPSPVPQPHHIPALNWPTELLDLIRKCLSVELSARPTMTEVLELIQTTLPNPENVHIDVLPAHVEHDTHTDAAIHSSSAAVVAGTNEKGKGRTKASPASPAKEQSMFADFEHATFTDSASEGINVRETENDHHCATIFGSSDVDAFDTDKVEFGEFEQSNDDFVAEWKSAEPQVSPALGSMSAVTEKPSPVILSAEMIDMITLETSTHVLKQGPVYVMRPRGFLKMVVRKQVWMVLTTTGLIVRKSTDLNSKLHFMLSLKFPLSIVPSDTLSIGLNGAILRGFCPKTLFSSEALADDEIIGTDIPKVQSDSHLADDSDAEDGPDDLMKCRTSTDMNNKARFREVIERQLEIGFDSKDIQSEWIDVIMEQYQVLAGF